MTAVRLVPGDGGLGGPASARLCRSAQLGKRSMDMMACRGIERWGRAGGFYLRLVALICLLGCVVVLLCGTTSAWAAEFDEASSDLTLAVSCQVDGAPQQGVRFSLYRVANVDESLQFSVTGEFTGYAVELTGLGSSGYKAAAETLAGYVARDALAPLAEGVTDEEGVLTFSSERSGLVPGLFLLVGEPIVAGGRLWAQEPALVCLPFPNGEGQWASSASVTPKVSEEGNVTSLAVHKTWDDGGYADRPAAVTVQLLRDGSVVDEIGLTAGDDWSHVWSDLAPGYVWSVVEKDVPNGYTVVVQREGSTLVLTNSRGSDGSGQAKLPQTGQMWWPVPVLLSAGLLCLAVGVVRRRLGTRGPRK